VTHYWLFGAVIGALALAGCATTNRTPVHLVASGGIGVAVISRSPADLTVVGPSAAHGETGGSSRGGTPAPGVAFIGLLLLPLEAIYVGVWSAQCQQKLDSVYPEASKRLPDVVEREVGLEDLRRAFVETFQSHTSVPVVPLDSSPTAEATSREHQLFATATAKALAYLLLIKPHYFGLGPVDRDCGQWALGTSLDVSLWSVADHKLVSAPLHTGPYVNVHLDDLSSLLNEPGTLRMRLAPNVEVSAANILDQRRFILAP